MTDKDRVKLAGVHPSLVRRVEQIFDALEALGYILCVTDGLRTTEQQQVLYAKGRTAPGPIVTNADGILHRSNHQAHADGFGHAVDCAFRREDGSVSWDLHLPWKAYGACADALGLVWGGDWKTLHDLPHVELP